MLKRCWRLLSRLLPEERLKRQADALAQSFVDEVSRSFKASCIVLFGSYARGDFTEYSDIDLCVISDELPKDLFGRRTIVTGIQKIKAIGFTIGEFSGMIDELNPLVLDILHYGKPLKGEEIYERFRKRLEVLIQSKVVEKYKDGWIMHDKVSQ